MPVDPPGTGGSLASDVVLVEREKGEGEEVVLQMKSLRAPLLVGGSLAPLILPISGEVGGVLRV